MDIKDDDKLMQDAARLATEIAPKRDLWPEIEASISAPPKRNWTPYFAQAAAVVVLVAASSMLTYTLTKEGPIDTPPPVGERPDFNWRTEVVMGGGEPIQFDQSFQIARGNLQTQLDKELGRLSPESRTEVERNLQVIREAVAEINEALEEEPDSVLLQDLLLKTYREELAVMRKVGGLTQSVMSRNDI